MDVRMKRIHRIFPVGLTLWLLMGVLKVHAQPKPADQVQVIQAEGCGTILGGDTARARDEALIDARRRALEKAFGVFIDSETIVRNAALFDSIVRARVPGFIQSDRILPGQEGQRGDGLYCVAIEAWVLPQELEERLPDLVSELSAIVFLPETNCGRPQSPRIIENQMISTLVRAGYRVLDVKQLRQVHQRDLDLAFQRGDREAANRLRFQFLASLLVGGQAIAEFSQDNQGIISARAQVEARAVLAETAQILANVPPGEARGFGSSCEVAGRRALQDGGKSAGETILEALDRYVHRKDREIELRLRGVPDLDTYRRVKLLVQGERWVTEVREGQFAPGESTLFLRYPEKTIYLATSLTQRPEVKLNLVEFGWGRIVVEFAR